MRVQIYRNLHKKCWSVRDKKTMKVIAHVKNAVLKNCKLVVRKGGRARVLKTKRKNVHAFIEGDYFPNMYLYQEGPCVTYDPYCNENFVDKHTGKSIEKASWCIFNDKMVCYML